jgi:plastocyanin
MQSKKSRVALLAAALVVAVAAFLVLRPGDEDDPAPTAEQAGQTEEAEDTAGDGGSGEDRGGPRRSQPEQEPAVAEIEIRNGDVVGGPAEIEVETGDRIEFVVTSDTPDEIHVHGYEITDEVAPNDPARLSFPADIEGIYEVEAHDIGHVVIAELRVTPS